MYEFQVCSLLLLTLSIVCLKKKKSSHSTDCKISHLVLIYISLMTNNVERLFMYTLAIIVHRFSFMKCLFKFFGNFFFWFYFFVFLLMISLSSLYPLHIRSLSDTCFAQIFSVACFLIFLMMSFDVQKL